MHGHMNVKFTNSHFCPEDGSSMFPSNIAVCLLKLCGITLQEVVIVTSQPFAVELCKYVTYSWSEVHKING